MPLDSFLGESIVEAGSYPRQLHLSTRGWAARCKELEDGSRQITDFLIAGDICDLSALGRLGEIAEFDGKYLHL